MQKEVRIMKALIVYSGVQKNGFILTEKVIQDMHTHKNEGKPLLTSIGCKNEEVCGYLNRTQLIWNKELKRLELWGYFTYNFDGVDFTKQGECSYSIAYSHEDLDNDNILHNASLINCTMMDLSK